MAIAINGDGTITGLANGGLPDGCILDADINGMAASKLTGALPAISGANLTGTGITEVDEWRFTSSFARQSTADITSNWERSDTIFSKIGTGMSESSGIFTFPSSGIWLIDMQINTFSQSGLSSWIELSMAYSTNSGTNFTTDTLYSYDHVEYQIGYYIYNTQQSQGIVDVQDASTWRVKFRCGAGNNSLNFTGSSTYKSNNFRFIRLGDT
tara:strand:- start:2612 stop:3244 length:633 start_codon:yes stop_codon:yes gene_type:complete